ncbi:hypothetical protein [Chryseobacterium rhizosphaerae]|uniref:hypothetical protein n=1 Tax=Chryseobacterium rhizosphaerae TaxID=395937 RepID=UPI0023598475|nr:hypothetical protein [Chryseobacterium rhizosphaerae]MDC8101666.1 hypothetical protein [Chryseobacterium rhizosphaerae]
MEFKYNSPIQYFVDVFKDSYLKTEIKRYLSLGFEEENGHIDDVDNDKGIIYLKDGGKHSFETYFYRILTHKLSAGKALIDNYVLPNPHYLKDYIRFLQSELQYIINNNPNTFYKFPSFLYFIIEIRDYVNNKFISNSDEKLALYIPNFNALKTSYSNDDELLHLVLDYLKGQNEKREKIISDDDFEFLISTIKAYIDNNTTEVGDRRIKEVNISQQLLSFTFWVLHKYLYGMRPRRIDFLTLVKQLFETFDSWTFNTFNKKFGSKGDVTYKGLNFIPQIIKQELEDRS